MTTHPRCIVIVGLLLLILLFVIACATPEQRAQKLLDREFYEEVVAKYPETPQAIEAKQRLAIRDYLHQATMTEDIPELSESWQQVKAQIMGLLVSQGYSYENSQLKADLIIQRCMTK